MSTFVKSKHIGNFSGKVHSKNKIASKFWQKAEFDHFGIIPLLLVILGGAGGLSIGFEAHSNIIKLALVAFPTVIALSITVVANSMRLIIAASVIALLFDIAIIIF